MVKKKEFQLSKEGQKELQDELAELQAKRLEVIEAIKTARSQGDLSENDEYHSAKKDQEWVEGRIAEVEHILANAEIVTSRAKSAVAIGTSVVLKNGGKKDVTYDIVDSVEADPLENKISDESPIGRALLGKKVGDKVEIDLPAGKKTYEVKDIK